MTDERFTPAPPGEDIDPEAERIVAEIEVTRTELGGTIDEIGHRLQPQTIVGNARDQLREATVGKVERLVDDAGQTAQQTTNTLMDTVRQNPVPAALAAVGIGWLALRFRDQQSTSSYGYSGNGNGNRYGYMSGYGTDARYGYEPRPGDPMSGVRDTADRAASTVQNAADEAAYRAQRLGADVQSTAQDAVEQARYTAQQAQWQAQQKLDQAQWQAQQTIGQAQRQFDRTLQENPLAVGALALGVGAAIALAIPETQKERELMGEQRDRLLDQASSVASDTLNQAEQKVTEVGTQLRSES
jgi:ElaB/YqjD/DUF883 family membrane-anchored ribosome-binding protein